MSKKTYRLSSFEDFEAVVQVDTDLLTPDAAAEINSFWGGAEDRLSEQDGDVVLTVVRLFGSRCIYALTKDGTDSVSGRAAQYYAEDVLDDEGWPGKTWAGLALLSAEAPVPGYSDLTLEEAS